MSCLSVNMTAWVTWLIIQMRTITWSVCFILFWPRAPQWPNTCTVWSNSISKSLVLSALTSFLLAVWLKTTSIYWPMRIKEHSDEELAGGGLTCSISSSLKWLSSRITWYDPPVSLVRTVHTRTSADRPITDTRTFRDFRVWQRFRVSLVKIHIRGQWPAGTTGWESNLDQLIDVGWVTCGEATEYYKDLPAGMSWHVPLHKDRQRGRAFSKKIQEAIQDLEPAEPTWGSVRPGWRSCTGTARLHTQRPLPSSEQQCASLGFLGVQSDITPSYTGAELD